MEAPRGGGNIIRQDSQMPPSVHEIEISSSRKVEKLDGTSDVPTHVPTQVMTDGKEFMDDGGSIVEKEGRRKVMFSKEEEKIHRYVVLPDSKFYKRLTFFRVFFLCYCFFEVPLDFSFIEPKSHGPFFFTGLINDCFFLVDMIITFFLAYYDKNGTLVTDPAKIRKRYLRGRWFWDLLPITIPYMRFVVNANYTVEVLFNLPLLLRVQRLLEFFSYLELDYHSNVRGAAVLKFFLYIFGCGHWFGCIWYFISRCYDFSWDTWVSQYAIQHPSGFINLQTAPDVEKYLHSLFWGFLGATTLGYGEQYMPLTEGELIWSLVVMLSQMILYSYILSTIFSYIVKKDEFIDFFRKKMLSVEAYISAHNLPTNIQAQLRSYFHFQLQNKKGDDKVFQNLPENLKMKVAVHLDDRLLEGVSVFQDCDEQFIHSMLVMLREVTIMPSEMLVKANDMSRELFFVQKGSVEYWAPSADDSKLSKDHGLLGELSFFLLIPQPYYVRAKAHNTVTVKALSKEAYESLLVNFPEANDIITRNVLAQYGLDKTMKKTQEKEQVTAAGKGKSSKGSKSKAVDEQYERIKNAIVSTMKQQNQQNLVALTYAASAGALDEVKNIVLRGLDIDMGNYDNRTTLHLAAAEGNMKVVEFLVQQGADVNICDRWNGTPLQDAIQNRHDGVAKLLAKAGAQLLLENGATKLNEAASTGNVDTLKRLVEYGVDPDQGDYDGRTALHLAAAEGKVSVAEYLMRVKANVNCEDRWGQTPLVEAIKHKHTLVALMLRQNGGELNLKDTAGELCSAASEGDLNRLKLLVENGADVNAGDYDQRTALHLAAVEGHVEAVKILIFLKADVNYRDRWGNTPLHDAILNGRKEVAEMLKANGAVEGKEDEGDGALPEEFGTDMGVEVTDTQTEEKLVNSLKEMRTTFNQKIDTISSTVKSEFSNLETDIENKMEKLEKTLDLIEDLADKLRRKKDLLMDETRQRQFKLDDNSH